MQTLITIKPTKRERLFRSSSRFVKLVTLASAIAFVVICVITIRGLFVIERWTASQSWGRYSASLTCGTEIGRLGLEVGITHHLNDEPRNDPRDRGVEYYRERVAGGGPPPLFPFHIQREF